MRSAARLLLLLLLAVPATGNASDAPTYLQIQDASGKVLFSLAVNNGSMFGIRFIHSVAKSPVEDWYGIENGTIFLEKTIYQDFGAGLPHEPGPGQTMACANGYVTISGFHRQLASFDVRVGRIAGHALLLPAMDGQQGVIPLNSLAPPGNALTFTTFSAALQ